MAGAASAATGRRTPEAMAPRKVDFPARPERRLGKPLRDMGLDSRLRRPARPPTSLFSCRPLGKNPQEWMAHRLGSHPFPIGQASRNFWNSRYVIIRERSTLGSESVKPLPHAPGWLSGLSWVWESVRRRGDFRRFAQRHEDSDDLYSFSFVLSDVSSCEFPNAFTGYAQQTIGGEDSWWRSSWDFWD